MLLNSDKNPFLGSTKAMGQEYEREIESWREKVTIKGENQRKFIKPYRYNRK